jgi:hypothetical protein
MPFPRTSFGNRAASERSASVVGGARPPGGGAGYLLLTLESAGPVLREGSPDELDACRGYCVVVDKASERSSVGWPSAAE